MTNPDNETWYVPPSTPPPPPPPVQPFPGYTGAPQSYPGPQLPAGPPGYPAAPTVPALANGKGDTSVNTDALGVVAGNIGQLYDAVQQAYSVLTGTPKLAPGGLFESYELIDRVGYPNDGSTSSLADSYLQVLQDLSAGLYDIRGALQQMQSTYSTFDDMNKMKVQDLENDLSNAEADFSNVMTDNGGTAPGTWPAPLSPASPLTKNPKTKTP